MPETPGVYIMKDSKKSVLYVGKAVNLKRRVSSYFQRPHDYRISKMVSLVRDIEIKNTDTAIEALILESKLIKKYLPPYNVLEKDDKSFLYVEITKEKFPRVLLTRGKDLKTPSKGLKIAKQFGPFTSSSSLKEALKILRKIFPWSVHSPESLKLKVISHKLHSTRACFEYELGLCPGVCISAITPKEYKKNISRLIMFFEGKKATIIRSLKKEMSAESKKAEFEKAEKLKRQIFALNHIHEVALIKEDYLDGDSVQSKMRIEGYDISNISGTSAVGSMVVFVDGVPAKEQYKKFRIRTIDTPNDTGMLREVIDRRLSHPEWPLPDILLIDGGAPQVNAVMDVLESKSLRLRVLGLAKGPERKNNDVIGVLPKGVDIKTLIQIRDEAHRFAVSYHRKLRYAKMMER
ncbi:MAG: GIY-YIG nuclease family protein [Candidatus Omnitrophica bacterium]|nr:GIY-YIG nuclease family protein [Candidatus Omnitrophota bacterium]